MIYLFCCCKILESNKGVATNKTISLAVISLAVLSFSGCNEEAKAKLTKPAITNVVVVDGCTVKYVDRGRIDNSFYIARCDNTATITGGYDSGDSHTPVVTVVDAEKLQAAGEELQLRKEVAEMTARKTAMEKLSPEEKAALGISVQ